ncbi:MAG: hypothetical protein Q8916_05430 [Bacteroidota bacterium]|nr:hypothetical protein [Bacteroidota bacterium]
MFGIIALSFLLEAGSLCAQVFPQRFWWTPGSLSSLPVIDSLQNSNSLSIINFDFQHALSLYSWGTSLRLGSNSFLTSGPTLPRFSVSAEGRSRLREDTRVRTSEANALIDADYPFDSARNGLTLSFFGTTYSLQSGPEQAISQIGTLSDVTDGYGVLGGQYFPSSKIKITAGGGIARKSFAGGTGSGTIFKAGIFSDPTILSEENTLDGAAALDERHFNLADETLRNDNVHLHLLSNFGESGNNDAFGGVAFKRRDFFFLKDTSGSLAKQERSEVDFELHDALLFPIIKKRLISNFRVDLIPQQITRRTPSVDLSSLPTTTLVTSTFLVPSTTNALEAAFSGRLDLAVGDLNGTDRLMQFSAEMKFDERSEANDILKGETGALSALEVQKLSSTLDQTSFDGKLTSLQLSANFPIAEKDSLHADFSSRIYRYDTPSSDNHDDRDELNLASTLQYIHFFSRSLEMTSEIRLAQSHLVYLESDRSLQNYVSKTIALASQVEFRIPSFEHQVRAEVFANYSVYDFSAPVTSPDGARDYLIRGINGSDSVRLSLGRFPILWDALTQIEGIFDLRLYERGAYNVQAFTERPILRTTEFSGDLTCNLADRASKSPTLVKLGARVFLQRRYAPVAASAETSLSLQERLDRIGPLLIVTIDQLAALGPRLYGSIWYSFVSQQTFDTVSSSSSRQVEARLAAQWSF